MLNMHFGENPLNNLRLGWQNHFVLVLLQNTSKQRPPFCVFVFFFWVFRVQILVKIKESGQFQSVINSTG